MYNAIDIEDKYAINFFNKTKLVIERGKGVFVWDDKGKKYLDLTAGFGVTSLGHSPDVIIDAICKQSQKIIQNPNSGLTYSPAKADFLLAIVKVLPDNLQKIFYANSGAEANDALIKIARKSTGKKNVISAINSFHGRTIGTVSATAQSMHRDKFSPLMPNHLFVEYNNIPAIEKIISENDDIAAIILEPIQGEGGVNVPKEDYFANVSKLCKKSGILFIADEVQTGFYRTGKAFASSEAGIDLMSMGKCIASGFPFAAFAISKDVEKKVQIGDHGGTYCGNPLACSVSAAVINHMLETKIWENVEEVGKYCFEILKSMQVQMPDKIVDVRGKGLLIAMELKGDLASLVAKKAIEKGLLLNISKGHNIRIFPALNITKEEMKYGLDIIKEILLEMEV